MNTVELVCYVDCTWLSRPSMSNMRKKRTDQSGEIGSWTMALG